jgi:hypothetical protein
MSIFVLFSVSKITFRIVTTFLVVLGFDLASHLPGSKTSLCLVCVCVCVCVCVFVCVGYFQDRVLQSICPYGLELQLHDLSLLSS